LSTVGVAHEYGLDELQQQSEQSCICALTFDNIKSLLQSAHLYTAMDLKNACFAFVERHSAVVLTCGKINMMSLMSEEPDLWRELASAMSGKADAGAAARGKRKGSPSGGSRKQAKPLS